mgnify:CR=1 FL=1
MKINSINHKKVASNSSANVNKATPKIVEAPNKVKVVEYTSHHSKFDPSKTVFALVDDSLESFVNFLNRFSGMKLKKEDFKFLDQNDNYQPS